ncbi:hypothetical protein RIF29_41641 [Crotalaria pallida]|uniref:J domain-containing protein n=1 Tax=Crotalaria pallida TaxID=3830 RepID=A0AAN9E642_CROPI
MNMLSLSSSQCISKPFHCLPLSNNNNHQRRPPNPMQFSVSCTATTTKTTHAAKANNNFYNLLSLSPKNATMDDIKRAYRLMALKYHPDLCHDVSKKEESTRKFVQLNAAYKTLSNPRLRAEYDSELLGLRSQRRVGDEYDSWRCRWQEQVVELKRRSHRRSQKEGSWGSRMRAQNMNMRYQNL